MNNNRYLQKYIIDDLKTKMVFLAGPRQVGKTTLALKLLHTENTKHPAYLNWDDLKTRKSLIKGDLPANQNLIVLDEIHKYKKWRNLVKGFYDTHKSDTQFLITGSAKLNLYSRGGDSLQGRYHFHRLHPFSINELGNSNDNLNTLLEFGGFPEPLFSQSKKTWRRWQKEKLRLIIEEDVRTLERVQEIQLLELLASSLPDKIGSQLSFKSLAEDLSVSDKTVKNWIQILENLYFCFRIPPYGGPKLKATKKEQKLFMWDWSTCELPGIRFENLVACQLLKYCHFLEDTEGYDMELRYFRDVDQREVDFIVLKDKKPIFAVEAKLSDDQINKNLIYLEQRSNIPQLFQVHMGKKDYIKSGTRCRSLPFLTFAKELNLP